jgi:hypothetical protein
MNSPYASPGYNYSGWDTPLTPSALTYTSTPFFTSNSRTPTHVHTEREPLPIYSPPSSLVSQTPTAVSRHGKRKRKNGENTAPELTAAELAHIRTRIQELDNLITSFEDTLARFKHERDVLIEKLPSTKKRAYTPRKTIDQKLEAVFAAISGPAKWTLDESLYYLFRLRDEYGNEVSRTQQHAGFVSKFLGGETTHGPAVIIDAWFHNPDGRESSVSGGCCYMYSTTKPYVEIRPARAVLTSFAVQTVRDQLVKEADNAVKQHLRRKHASKTRPCPKGHEIRLTLVLPGKLKPSLSLSEPLPKDSVLACVRHRSCPN